MPSNPRRPGSSQRPATRTPAKPGSPGRGGGGTRRPGGTSTRPPAPKQQAEPEAAAPTRRFTSRAVILLAIVLLLLASYTSSLHAWWEQRSQIESTKAEIAALTTDISGIERDFSRYEDSAYIEQQARARFGWVMPGEIGYRVIGEDGKVVGAAPVLGELPTAPPQEWYGKLWGTVEKAGEVPKPKKVEPTVDPDKVLKGKKTE